jgi:hypothetical protein
MHLEVEAGVWNDKGGALVSAVFILLLLTILATAGLMLARAEADSAQAHAQAVRALYASEAGFARYFASHVAGDSVAMVFEFYEDPCLDETVYPTIAEQTACQDEGESEEDEFLEDLETITPPPASYTFLNTDVMVTADFAMNDGITSIYELFSMATVSDSRDPGLTTTRMLARYGQMKPPFDINSTFAAAGGLDFGADADDHYHFDGKAKAGKTGSCGTEVAIPSITVPQGQWDLDLSDPDCPGGKDCPYKWHSKGLSSPDDVDSTFVSASGIKTDIGIDWGAMLTDTYYNQVSGVIGMDDSDDLEAYFTKDKDKMFKAAPEWPIVRFTGDLTTDVRVKGYGILIVDGDMTVAADKLEWTGMIMVGGKIISLDGSHLHVKGAALAGLSCSDDDVDDGLCRSVLDGDHNDVKYRPCEIAQSWRRLMFMTPRDGLWREISGN